jgi:hypothetical protein
MFILNFLLFSQSLNLSFLLCLSTVSSGPQTAGSEDDILRRSSNLKSYTFAELEIATGDFDRYSIIGLGGFGVVYKGWIHQNSLAATKPGTGISVAVKRLRPKSLQGHREWLVSLIYLLFKSFAPNVISFANDSG